MTTKNLTNSAKAENVKETAQKYLEQIKNKNIPVDEIASQITENINPELLMAIAEILKNETNARKEEYISGMHVIEATINMLGENSKDPNLSPEEKQTIYDHILKLVSTIREMEVTKETTKRYFLSLCAIIAVIALFLQYKLKNKENSK